MKITDIEAYDGWYRTPFGSFCHRLERDALFSLAAFTPGEPVLDAGCGTGIYLAELKDAGAKPFGLDNGPEMLRAARRRLPDARLVAGDLAEMPFKDGSFSKALSVCALEFAPYPEKAFKELRRVLEPAGILLVGFLNGNSAWAAARVKKSESPGSIWRGVKFYTLSEVERMGAASGFRLTGFRTAVHFPPEAEGKNLYELTAMETRGKADSPSAAAFIAAGFRKVN